MELTLREDGASSLVLGDAAGEMRTVLGLPPEGTLASGQGAGRQREVALRRAGTGRAIIAAEVAFLGTGAAAAGMILLRVPTLSPYRLVARLASMFAVTAGIVTATVAWACGQSQDRPIPPCRLPLSAAEFAVPVPGGGHTK